MSPEGGTRVSSLRWLRLALALAAAAGLAVLARRRPPFPPLLAPLEPTATEEFRQAVALIAWLLLVLVCLLVVWHALRPTRSRKTMRRPEPPRRPSRRMQQAPVVLTVPTALPALFASPRSAHEVRAAEPEAPLRTRPDTASLPATEDLLSAAKRPRLLHLYGPLAIEGSDGAGLGQRPTRGLIAYLALKRGPASSNELLEALWPGQPPASTRSRLWKARRQAQQLLGEALQRQRDAYLLDRRVLPCDSDEIERLQQGSPDRARIEQAVALIVGQPLIDIDYPWADTERRRLQALMADTLAKAATVRLADRDQHGALTAAERLIELDLLNEQGWRLAMEAEAALGQRQAILDRYQALARELDERLGLRPAAETRETYHRLLGQE